MQTARSSYTSEVYVNVLDIPRDRDSQGELNSKQERRIQAPEETEVLAGD